MKGCSFVPLVVLLLFVSGTLCGSVTPRFLVLAETPAIATNLVSAISATLTALGSVTSHDDTTYNTGDPTCYLCSAISTSYAGVIWQLGTNIETLSSYATIKQNIQDFVNTGRVVILTGTSIFATQEPNGNLLNTVGAKDYFPHINPATGNGGQLTDYAICDPMLKGFFGDIRLRTPASFGTTIFNQAEVETLVPGAGLASCWEVTYSDLAVGGRFTVRQLTNGGILSYMQCDAANSMSEFTQSFYNIGYNNLLDYSLGLENGTIRIATTPATNRIAIVSTMPVDQLASPATGLYPVKYVPLLDFFGGESPSSSFMGSPISILTYKAVVIVLHNSGYSSDPNWSTYANNLQNFADSGGLVLVYGATPQLSTDTGFVTLLGGASTVADTSGISNVGFGNFATCSKILNGPFGSYVSLNPRTADSTFTGQFDGVTVDTISGGTAVPCLSTFGGNGVITYQNALNNGLFVYIASPTINDPSENFQYITESYYRDIYNNLLANFLGLSGGAGGDPHIFLFGGEEIELNFESGKSYKFYGSHEFSVGITTVGYLNTIFIANVGVTMGTHHLMATSSLTHPVFKYNGETLPVGSIVHTPIGEAEVFIPEPRHVRGALSEMQEYLTIGIRIGDHLEIVGGVYKPFIFFNIEVTRNSASNEFGLLHSAHAFNQRSVDFVQQFETDSVFF